MHTALAHGTHCASWVAPAPHVSRNVPRAVQGMVVHGEHSSMPPVSDWSTRYEPALHLNEHSATHSQSPVGLSEHGTHMESDMP